MQVTQAESGSLGVAYFCFIEAARKHNIDTGASRLRRPGFSEFADAHPAKSGGTKALHIPDAKPFVCVHTSTRMYSSTPTPNRERDPVCAWCSSLAVMNGCTQRDHMTISYVGFGGGVCDTSLMARSVAVRAGHARALAALVVPTGRPLHGPLFRTATTCAP